MTSEYSMTLRSIISTGFMEQIFGRRDQAVFFPSPYLGFPQNGPYREELTHFSRVYQRFFDVFRGYGYVTGDYGLRWLAWFI